MSIRELWPFAIVAIIGITWVFLYESQSYESVDSAASLSGVVSGYQLS